MWVEKILRLKNCTLDERQHAIRVIKLLLLLRYVLILLIWVDLT